MRVSSYLAPLAAVLIVCGASGVLGQQSGQTAPPPSKDNTFPLAQSESAAKGSKPAQTTSPQPNANKPGSSTGTKSPTAQANPFPEAQSKAAAKTDSSQQQPSSSSSSAAGYSSSDADMPPAAVGEGSLGSHTRMDSYTRDKTQDGRIADDLKVADFYMKNGNYRGALWRYQDTLQYDPQNDTALYGVAEAMCRQNLTTEAMAHFESYANSHPQGKYALKAEKMLAHPNKCKHNW